MATRTGFFQTNELDVNDTYFPFFIGGTTGMNITGVDSDIQYKINKKTLTLGNINTTTINGTDTSYLNSQSFPRITPNGVLGSTWSVYIDTLLDDTLSVLDYLVESFGNDYVKRSVDTTDKLSSLIYGSGVLSIVMTGFSDLLNLRALFTDKFQGLYTQMILGIALSLSIPANRIQDVRDSSWARVGTWEDHSVLPIGLASTTPYLNSSIEKNVGTTRYIAVRVGTYNASVTPYSWEIYVNNVLVGKIQGTTPTETIIDNKFLSFAVILDLGENVDNCLIKIVNKRTDTGTRTCELDYVACYTDEDLVNATPVLLTSVPRFTDGVSERKRMLLNDSREAVARTCRLMGLPVSYYDLSEASTLMTGQTPLLTTNQHQSLARELLQEAFVLQL